MNFVRPNKSDKFRLRPVSLMHHSFEIFQSENGHGITSDAADFVTEIISNMNQNKQTVLEIGSGSGIISILLKLNRPNLLITAIEIQKQLVELSWLNATQTKTDIDFKHKDLRNFSKDNEGCFFDFIFSNPPHFIADKNRISPNRERAISRFEIECKMSDIIDIIDKHLTTKGIAFLLYPAERTTELAKLLKINSLEIVSQKEAKSQSPRKKTMITKIKKC